jgi:hypothetical protein
LMLQEVVEESIAKIFHSGRKTSGISSLAYIGRALLMCYIPGSSKLL